MGIDELDRSSIDHVLTTTRAVRRRFDLDRSIPLDLVHACLEIALQAPTGFNLQNWRLVVTNPGTRAAIAEIVRRIELPFLEAMDDDIPDAVSQAGLILVAYFQGEDFRPGPRRPRWRGRLPRPLWSATGSILGDGVITAAPTRKASIRRASPSRNPRRRAELGNTVLGRRTAVKGYRGSSPRGALSRTPVEFAPRRDHSLRRSCATASSRRLSSPYSAIPRSRVAALNSRSGWSSPTYPSLTATTRTCLG